MTEARCSADADREARRSADLSARVLAEARSWIGTPYRHQASVKGAGADCLGLVRGVWRAVCGPEPETPPPYSPDWGEHDGAEALLAAAARHLMPVETPRAGDVLVFRLRVRGPAKHAAILATDTVTPGRILHAWSGAAVCETALPRAWVPRIAGAFRFPSPE